MALDREKLSDKFLKAELRTCNRRLNRLLDAAEQVLELFPNSEYHPAINELYKVWKRISEAIGKEPSK